MEEGAVGSAPHGRGYLKLLPWNLERLSMPVSRTPQPAFSGGVLSLRDGRTLSAYPGKEGTRMYRLLLQPSLFDREERYAKVTFP